MPRPDGETLYLLGFPEVPPGLRPNRTTRDVVRPDRGRPEYRSHPASPGVRQAARMNRGACAKPAATILLPPTNLGRSLARESDARRWRTEMGRPGCRSIFSVVRTGVAALSLAVFGSAGVAYGQDVVITTSGDRLVGEIKRVEKDVLTSPRTTRMSTSRSSGETSPSHRKQAAVHRGDVRRQASVGLVEPRPGQEAGRADRRDERAAGGSVGGAAVRADVLVAVRLGAGLRLQHDANQLGDTALARDEHLVPRRALCRCHLRQRLQQLAGQRARHASDGTSGTTSAVSWAAGGTPTPPRTS